MIQASLGNPLADPYTIGIAAAAALGVVVGSALPFTGHFSGDTASWITSGVLAFTFSVGATFILGAWLKRSFKSATEVILVGIVASLFFSAMATFVRAITDPGSWVSSMGWLMGHLETLSIAESVMALLAIAILCVFGWLHWKPLDLIAVDELTASSAGVNVEQIRKRTFFLVALITAVCVSVSGIIGFVGLIVPHIMKLIGFRSHRSLIPVSFIAGATLLLIADVLSRVLVWPSEIPVGVVTAILGAPIFLSLLRKVT
jgi:iron complex transport system permease protein